MPQPCNGKWLRELCLDAGIQTAAALGHRVGTSKITAWYWWNRRAMPSLPMALRIAQSLGIHLVDALFRQPVVPGRHQEQLQLELHLSSRARPREIPWKSVRRRLERELAQPIESAQSLFAVSRELKIAARTLREREPSLCRRIGRRYLRKQRLAAAAEFGILKTRIRSACLELRYRGGVFSPARVAASIGEAGLFRSPVARRALAEILQLPNADWPKAVTMPGITPFATPAVRLQNNLL
jgi:transcriptional regulator with XRE-family HTH domain